MKSKIHLIFNISEAGFNEKYFVEDFEATDLDQIFEPKQFVFKRHFLKEYNVFLEKYKKGAFDHSLSTPAAENNSFTQRIGKHIFDQKWIGFETV